MASVDVQVFDRLDRAFTLQASVGRPMSAFLAEHHIPLDTVVTQRNGEIVSETDYVVEAGDRLEVAMVRAYHLPDFLSELRLWPLAGEQEPPESPDDALYAKRMLWFDESGQARLDSASLGRDEYAAFLEDYFVGGILDKELIEEGDKVGLALSGGRDSLSLLYLLSRTRDRLPDFEISGVTVEGLSKPLDLEIASEACANVGMPHGFVAEERIQELFDLSGSMEEALEAIFQSFGIGQTINAVHAFMRTGVEHHFKERGVQKIAFGLHNEDLLASLIRTIVDAYPFGESFYKKGWGDFEFIYPLWPITKKELTIYLEVVAPRKHNSQGSPTPYDRGGWNRDIQYFLADSMQTLWPGFSFHAFEGYQRLMAKMISTVKSQQCTHCGATHIWDPTVEQQVGSRCYLCHMLAEVGQIRETVA